jgi:hypothetical protein
LIKKVIFFILLVLPGLLTFESCSAAQAPTTDSTKVIPPPPFMENKTNPSGKPTIEAFDISPDVIKQHLEQRATIHWNVTGATTIYISNIGYVPPVGTTIARPESTMIFTITASNRNGTVSISKRLTVLP